MLLVDDMSSSQIIIESDSKSWIEAIKDGADQSCHAQNPSKS